MSDDDRQPLSQWLDRAIAEGWLSAEIRQRFERLERQRAEDLFRDRHHRPLLVALFGGTGVGKSSLLNRLAGQPIARIGLQRPTSLEVSIYLHRDFQLDLLPPELPMAQTRIAYHDEEERRLLAWIDMPDMDSTDLANRRLVESWLPYIDWIIYVVSPERYHDDLGWRFLQQRGQRHAWIFVMNQWDQGRPEQREDFRRRLAEEGFSDPVLLCTSCLTDAGEDDLQQLERRINQAIQQHSLSLLQQLGISARHQDQQRLLRQIADQLDASDRWQKASRDWLDPLHQGLERFTDDLQAQGHRQITALAGQKADLASLPGRFEPLIEALVSQRNQDLIGSLELQRLNDLASSGLAVAPFERELAGLAEPASRLRHWLERGLDQALEKPGHGFRRALHRINLQLEWLLPLAASGWAIQHALVQFYRGTQEQAAFLGLDFAIHALLLIGLGWLLPRLLREKLQPSAAGVLRQGLAGGLLGFRAERLAEHQALWQRLEDERQRLSTELDEQFLQPLSAQEQTPELERGSLTPQGLQPPPR